MVKYNSPSHEEIEQFQKFYDGGNSCQITANKFGWCKQTVMKYIKVRKPKVTEEERRLRKVLKVVSWRQRTKKKLVDYKGGKCKCCGYDRCIWALDFHHLDPEEKEFSITGKTISFERLKKEVDKCELVCSNCHREIEAGIRTI